MIQIIYINILYQHLGNTQSCSSYRGHRVFMNLGHLTRTSESKLELKNCTYSFDNSVALNVEDPVLLKYWEINKNMSEEFIQTSN